MTEYTLHVCKEKNEKLVYLKICILNLVSHFNIFEKPKLNLYFPQNQDTLSVTPEVQILMLGQARILAYIFVNISPNYACTSLIILKLPAVKRKIRFNSTS